MTPLFEFAAALAFLSGAAAMALLAALLWKELKR